MNFFIKEFANENWLMVISMIKKFIEDYNLAIISIDIERENSYYIGILKYDLGVNKR